MCSCESFQAQPIDAKTTRKAQISNPIPPLPRFASSRLHLHLPLFLASLADAMVTNAKHPHCHLLRPIFVIVLAAILLPLRLHFVAAAAEGKGMNRSSPGSRGSRPRGRMRGTFLPRWKRAVAENGGRWWRARAASSLAALPPSTTCCIGRSVPTESS